MKNDSVCQVRKNKYDGFYYTKNCVKIARGKVSEKKEIGCYAIRPVDIRSLEKTHKIKNTISLLH